jgi:hypothetical protein
MKFIALLLLLAHVSLIKAGALEGVHPQPSARGPFSY